MILRLTILAILFLAIAAAALPAAAQIVPEACRGSKIFDNPSGCTLCHIAVMAINLTNFLMFNIAIPAVALLVAIGGIMLLVSGGSETRVSKGKEILTKTVIGAAIVFLAWLGVDTAIKVLSDEKSSFIGTFGPWNKIDPTDCPLSRSSGRPEITAPTAPTAPAEQTPLLGSALTPSGISLPRPTPAALAAQAQGLLNNYGSAFSTMAECGGNTNALNTIQVIAQAQPPPVCSANCQCSAGGVSGSVTVDSRVLGFTERILRAYPGMIEVTSYTTGRHSANSLHYQGRAVDLKIRPGTGLTYPQLESLVRNSIGGNSFFQCESGGARVDCRNPPQPIDHIHAQYNS